jgi:hypothetical protein
VVSDASPEARLDLTMSPSGSSAAAKRPPVSRR